MFKTMGHAVILPNLPRSHYGSTPTKKLGTGPLPTSMFPYIYICGDAHPNELKSPILLDDGMIVG